MGELVADTSELGSLAIVARGDRDPQSICFNEYDVLLTEELTSELQELASYEDVHGRAATDMLDFLTAILLVEISYSKIK